jgi:hypothetical protein
MRPVKLADYPQAKVLVRWTLERSGQTAQCVLQTVGDTLELHISMTEDVVLSQQCRGPEQAYALSQAWWAALVERGWSEQPSHVREPRSIAARNGN